ncbi:hypothetical protein MAUB1S_03131 [Mycolicibacterium aubagnense]
MPFHFGGVAVESSGTDNPHARAIDSKRPPMVSVADVSTAVTSPNSRPRSSPATDSGATRRTYRTEPLDSSRSSHTTS